MSERERERKREEADEDRAARIEAGVRTIREGHGANCSSIGSVIDTIFASAVLGGALLAAVVAALGREKVRVVGDATTQAGPPPATKEEEEEEVEKGPRA